MGAEPTFLVNAGYPIVKIFVLSETNHFRRERLSRPIPIINKQRYREIKLMLPESASYDCYRKPREATCMALLASTSLVAYLITYSMTSRIGQSGRVLSRGNEVFRRKPILTLGTPTPTFRFYTDIKNPGMEEHTGALPGRSMESKFPRDLPRKSPKQVTH